jgi:hypothetical protein
MTPRRRSPGTIRGMSKKTGPKGKKSLTQENLGITIQDVHELVKSRMHALGMTPYSLAKKAQALGGKLTEQTVRNFIAGTHGMTSMKFAAVLAALGLEIRPKE